MSRTTSTGHPVIVDERDHEIGSLRKLARDHAAEIARLTAELAAARAAPADVEDAIAAVGLAAFEAGAPSPTLHAAERHLRTAIARAISDATAAGGTVGGLLATHLKAFRTGTVAIECFDGEFIGQFIYVEDIVDRLVGGEHQQNAHSYCTYRTFDEQWVDEEYFDHVNGLIDALNWPARLVSTTEDSDGVRVCDLDPSQRGPLPKGG